MKHFLTSKGIWGGLLGLAACVAGLLGITPEEQAQAMNYAVSIAAGIGGLLSIIGRIRARARVTWRRQGPSVVIKDLVQ
jgi:uncharacterized membrane protein HdeD (DUF308 family)